MVHSHDVHLWVATVSAAFGAGFLIYSTYVTNNLQVVGEQWLNESFSRKGWHPTAEQLSISWANVIAAKEVGKIAGTLLIPYVAETFGRRGGLLLNNVVVLAGCVICLFSNRFPYYVLMFGRVLLGVSMICGVGLASMFLIEVAPLKLRGSSGALIQIFRGLGGTAGMVFALPELLGRPSLWTFALAIPAVPALFQFLVLLFCMESPRHLYITAGKTNAAADAVRFYQGPSRVSSAIEDLAMERKRIGQQVDGDGFCDLLKSKDFWRPVLLTTLALSNRSLAGILPVQSYSTDMFMAAGFSSYTAAHSTVVLGVCHLVSATVVAFTVENYGRKLLLIGSNFGCLASLLMVALFTAWAHVTWARYMAVISLALYMLVYPVVASISNIVASEICHQRIRSYAFTIGLLVYSIIGLASTYTYPMLKHSVGLSCSFIPFCLCLLVTVVIYAIYLPETRGKTFESVAFETTGSDGRSKGIRKRDRRGGDGEEEELILVSDSEEGERPKARVNDVDETDSAISNDLPDDDDSVDLRLGKHQQ